MTLSIKHRRLISGWARGPVAAPRETGPAWADQIAHLRNTRSPVRWTRLAAAKLAVYVASAAASVLAIALVPSCVKAQESSAAEFSAATRVVTTLGAYHPDRTYARERDLADFTPGLGLEREISRSVTLTGGYLRNSYRRDSLYAAAAWQPITVLGVRAGLMAGVITGYPINGGGITDAGVFGAGVLSLQGPRLGANLVLMPKVADKTHGAIALQLTWRV